MRLLINVAWWLRSAFMGVCLWLAGGALALTIPATPLGAGQVVEPNVLYLLDDSGSMMWDIMPDEGVAGGYHGFLFPPPDSVYGSTLYYTDVNLNGAYVNKDDWAGIHLAIPSFSDENIYSVYLRSSRGNSVFYDPNKTYLPWLDHVGMPYGVEASLQDANPRNAYWNPANPGAGSLNLTVWQTSDMAGQPWVHWFYANVANYSQAVNNRIVSTRYAGGYYPMTFYVYDGGNDQQISSYTKYQIRGDNAYSRKLPNGVEKEIGNSLVWPGATRTVAQEQINFANWFQYYRSRILAVKGATSRAFSELSSGYRIGLATINLRGSSNSQYEFAVPFSGNFSGSNRKSFFSRLFVMPVYTSGTPLRSALSWAGDQYSNDYWQDEISCRRAFTILTTDGYWNAEADIEVGNVDGDQPPPFSDSQSNTLADVAMYYWKTDLSGLKNDVRPLPGNPQTQQHMTTFGLSLGTRGELNPLLDLPALTAGTLAWPNPFNSRPAKIDDLWHASINSRGRFIAASNPDEFRQGLVDALETIGSSVGTHSAGAVSSPLFLQGSMYFQTQFDASDWSGQLDAYALQKVGKNTMPAQLPTWRAAKLLTANGNRQIFVGRMSHASRAVPFSLPALSSVNGGLNAEMVDYLRGGRDNEAPAGLAYRERSSLLGDIVGSSPLYVGKPSSNLPASQLRPSMLYVSANDGMVHGFNAETGQELFAYIPSSALDKLKALVAEDYSAKHQYLVDGLLSSAEVKLTNGWRTYLAGSQGRGGASLFLLDITNPQDINERSLNTLKPVVWEFTQADDANLGLLARAAPHIVKLNDGNNYVLAPNGYNSKSDTASLFILPITKPARWQLARNYWRLATNNSKGNGLSAITPHDLDGNGTIDVVYAGDLKGNVWKFDLSATVPSQWRVALSGESLFQALGPDGLPQPIISAPVLAKHPGGSDSPASVSKTGLMVYVGTGRFLDECDQAGVICTGEASLQSIYGLWDYGGRVCQRAELLQQTLSNAAISDVASGTFRKVSNHALTYPPASIVASPCKVGSTARIDVASPSVRYPFPPFALPQGERALQSRFWLGWYMDLPSEDERVVGDLRVGRNRLEVMTYIPAINTNDVCAKGEDASYVLRVNALNGGTFRRPRFIHPALDKALAQDEPDADEVVGIRTKGSLGGVVIGNTLITAWRNGMPGEGITEPVGRTVRRVSWREIISD